MLRFKPLLLLVAMLAVGILPEKAWPDNYTRLMAIACGGPGCNHTTVQCGDMPGSEAPSGAGGYADTSDPDNCLIIVGEDDCNNCGLSSGQSADGGNVCSPDNCLGPVGVSDCVESACLMQHEQNHTNQNNSCPPCAREQQAYQTSANCVQQWLNQNCTQPYSSDCQDAQDLADLDNQAVQYMACLCQQANNGGNPGGAPPAAPTNYPAGACDTCGQLITNAASRRTFNDLYCTPAESPDNGITEEAWTESHFSPAQLADPAVSGDNADPDGDGVPNFYEYAFNTDPLRKDGGSSMEYYWLDDKFTIKFHKNGAARDLTYRIGVNPSLFGPWTYATLGAPAANDPVTFKGPIDILDSGGTQSVIAVDTVSRYDVQMRFFRFEVTKTGLTTVTKSFSVSPAVGYYSVTVTAGPGGKVVSLGGEVSCTGTTCTAKVRSGSSITLQAEAGLGYKFGGWSGDCQGSDGSCTLRVDRAKTVAAAFERQVLCGDGMIDSPEVCDGANLGGLTCAVADPAEPTGALGCTATCGLNLSGCCSEWKKPATAAVCGKCSKGTVCQVRSCGGQQSARCAPLVSPPAKTAAVYLGKYRVGVSWTAAVHLNGAKLKYLVYRRLGTNRYELIGITSGLTLNDLLPKKNGIYGYAVEAIDPAGYGSGLSPEAKVTVSGPAVILDQKMEAAAASQIAD